MDFRDYIEKTTPRAANDGTFYILYIYHYISRELYRTRPIDSFLAYSLRHAFCLRCTSAITAHLLLATTYVLDSGGLLMNVQPFLQRSYLRRLKYRAGLILPLHPLPSRSACV
jgi:hypothetical protein